MNKFDRRQVFQSIAKQFAIPVLRLTTASELINVTRALAAGGLSAVEITLMNDDALAAIRELTRTDGLLIGAGTVTHKSLFTQAVQAGAGFLVSPGWSSEIAEASQAVAPPYIPGVLTPSELMAANAMGFDPVKVFPISTAGGPSYLRQLLGPFPKLRAMVTGGIKLEEIESYRAAGAFAVGLGSNLYPAELVAKKDWDAIKEIAQEAVNAVDRAARQGNQVSK